MRAVATRLDCPGGPPLVVRWRLWDGAQASMAPYTLSPSRQSVQALELEPDGLQLVASCHKEVAHLASNNAAGLMSPWRSTPQLRCLRLPSRPWRIAGQRPNGSFAAGLGLRSAMFALAVQWLSPAKVRARPGVISPCRFRTTAWPSLWRQRRSSGDNRTKAHRVESPDDPDWPSETVSPAWPCAPGRPLAVPRPMARWGSGWPSGRLRQALEGEGRVQCLRRPTGGTGRRRGQGRWWPLADEHFPRQRKAAAQPVERVFR